MQWILSGLTSVSREISVGCFAKRTGAGAKRGKFLRRKVETETISMDEVRIVSGIEEGENVVIKGGVFLNI